jgi:hypothetical protein
MGNFISWWGSTMRYYEHKRAEKIIKELGNEPMKCLIIHYSCESFYDITDGKTPRITSIAVRSFESGQTDSFSIHKTAEKRHIETSEIESNYDELEKQMLEEFYKFVKNNKNKKWIHWNMRDINYGFKALEHRFEILGGTPEIISDELKFDLSRLLIQLYGVGYIGHPRMERLMEKNKITNRHWLNGQGEADAFVNKEFVKLHQSTLYKVDVFENIIKRIMNNSLKVNSKYTEIYGLSLQGIFEIMQSKWWGKAILALIMLALGYFIGKI